MRLLLINPNQFQNPPCPPIGLEYLTSYLREHEVYVDILDLTFSDDLIKDIDESIKNKRYDLIGITIRNIDSSIGPNNEFFLDFIKSLIINTRRYYIPIVLGGSGFSSLPNEILKYTNADFGIIGSGEKGLLKLLNDLRDNKANYTLIDGWKLGSDPNFIYKREKDINYNAYIEKGGILGFETQKGCKESCSYCIEANKKVTHKEISTIITELEFLIEQGFTTFHLCDSEFNQDLGFSKNICKAIIEKKLNMRWVLYMKPFPYDEEYFQLLKDSNAYLVTLTIVSDVMEQELCNYGYDDIKNIINLCKKYQIKLAIDLLIGAPYEPLESIEKMIDFLKKNRADTVGLSFNYRIGKYTKLAQIIQEDKNLHKMLSRELKEEEDYIQSIFFSQIDLNYVQKIVNGDPLFKIEGFEQTVNYQRL